jgi:hypothetical protein
MPLLPDPAPETAAKTITPKPEINVADLHKSAPARLLIVIGMVLVGFAIVSVALGTWAYINDPCLMTGECAGHNAAPMVYLEILLFSVLGFLWKKLGE